MLYSVPVHYFVQDSVWSAYILARIRLRLPIHFILPHYQNCRNVLIHQAWHLNSLSLVGFFPSVLRPHMLL